MSNGTETDDNPKESARPFRDGDSSALDHAWDWFKCHADQRIAMFRFYVIVTGGLATAVGVLHQQREHLLCVAVSMFAAFVCFCFKRLDNRTSDLVRLGEQAMRSEQSRLTAQTGNDHFNIALKADELTGCWPYTYGQVIRALLTASLALFVFFALWSAGESKHLAAFLRAWSNIVLSH